MINNRRQQWISMQRFLSKFRICTLILLLNMVIIAIIVPIVVGIQQINTNLLNQYFQESSMFTFINQNNHSLSSILNSYVSQIYESMNKTETQLLAIQKLYLNHIRYQYQGLFEPDMCHVQFEDDDPFKYVYQGFCVNIYDIDFLQYKTLPEKTLFSRDYNFITMLNEYILPFDPTQQFLPDNIYLSRIDREFSAWWPQWNRVEGYHPPERTWYKQHLENQQKNINKTCFTSDLYQFYATYPVVAMTITCSLRDEKGQLITILASDMQLLNQYYKHPRLNVMIVNFDGLLVMSTYQSEPMANSTELGYFYQQNMTGFNQDDWQQIINYVSQQNFISNCQTFKIFNNQLCRYNTLLEQDIIFAVQNLSYPNFVFLLFYNQTDEIFQLLDQRNIIDKINEEFKSNIFIFFIVAIILILIQLLFVWIIFLPLNDLIKHSRAYLRSNSHKLLFRQKEYYLYNFYIDGYTSNNVLLALKLAYKQIYHRISKQTFKKCIQCQAIQKFQYPYTLKMKFQNFKLESKHIEMTSIQILRSIIQPSFNMQIQII